MKGLIRGVVGAVVVLGATACADDYSIDFGGAPTAVQPSPEVMFLTSGTQRELLVRLINDRNQSTPASFQVTNIGAGLTVTYDDQYRPQWTSTNPILEPKADKEQQRYIVAANLPTGGRREFSLTSSGVSGTATVYILPTTLGNILSETTPDVGELITVNAPTDLSFTAASTVSFATGGLATITERTGKTLTVLPPPGSSGIATVTGVILDFSPTLAPRTLSGTDQITVPPVSGNFTGAGTLFGSVTLAIPGLKILPNAVVKIGGRAATTQNVAADGSSMTFLAGAGPGPVTVDGVEFLAVPGTTINGLTLAGAPAFPATTWSGESPDDNAPVLTAISPGTPAVLLDSWTNVGPDPVGFGGTGTTGKWAKLVVPVGGSYNVSIDWNTAGNINFGITDEAITVFLATALTSAKPESTTINLAAGTYWIVMGLIGNTDPPGRYTIRIQ